MVTGLARELTSKPIGWAGRIGIHHLPSSGLYADPGSRELPGLLKPFPT
jgi:hypothetical protein